MGLMFAYMHPATSNYRNLCAVHDVLLNKYIY